MKLTFLAICLMAFGIGADQCPLSIGCSSSKSPYISGSVYYYEFESLYDLKTTRQGDADETNAKITGTAKIYSNGDCSFTLQLENVFVSSQKENIRKMLGSEEVPVKFNMNGLGVINSQICVDASDNDYSLNLKRSIISLFASGEQKYETDLFGVCQTEKNIMPRKQITIKNLNKCSHRENFNLIKGVVDEQSGVHTSPLLHGNYIRESEFNENKVLNVNLKEIYIFGDKNSGLVEVKVSTNLKFLKSSMENSPKFGNAKSSSIIFEVPRSNYVKNADVLKKQFKKTVENFEDFVKFGSTENFVELLRLMRHSNTEALIDLSPVNEEGLARKIYLDALFRTGTSKSLSAILRQIPKMKENEKKMAYLSFYLIEDVTKENLNQAVDLVTNAAPKESYLALGHLVSKLCSRQSSLCNDSYLSRVTKKFTDSLKKCKSQTKTDEDKIVFILKGIKNSKKIGSSIASTLQLCSQAGSTRIRVASLQAFSSATCNADLQSKALSLLQNINEDSEIRIESYIALLHCPSAELANNIEKLVNNEPSNQVGTFISTHLRALKESNDKSKEAQKYYMQNIRVTKKFDFDWRRFSFSSDNSFLVESLGAGASSDLSVIYGYDGYLPRSMKWNVTAEIFGNSLNVWDFSIRQENLEQIIEGFLNSDNKYRFKRGIKEEIDKFSKKYKSHNNDLLFDVSLKFFGSEMFFLSLDNFEKFNMNNLLFKTEKKIETHSLFLDNRIIYPTGMGFPLELSAQGMSANKIEFDYNRLDNKWLLKIIPSFDVSISASISVDFSVFKNGLKISSEAHSATGVDAELLIDKNTIDNMSSVMGNINSLYGNLTNKISKRSTNTQSNEKFILTLNIPRSKLNIFEFKHSIAFIHQEPDKEEKKTLLKPKKKRNSQDQCFEQLLMFGAKLCYRADFSDFEYSDFFLTLSLENKLTFVGSHVNDGNHQSFVLVYDTPNSKNQHTTKLTTSLGLIPNTFARIELELANINKLFALELGLNNNENEKSLYFKQSENSQVTVYKAGLTKSSNEYYPVLEVDINGHKEPSIAGYRVYGKVIISGDIYILQNIKLTSPSTEITTLDGKISVGKEVIQTDLKLNKKTSLKCTLDLSGNPVYKLGLFIDENGAELHFGNGEIGGLIKGGDTNVKLSSKFDKEKIDIHLEWTNKNAKYLEILLSGRKNADISELTISFEKSGGKSAGLTFAISKDVEFKGRAFVNRHSIEIKGKKNGNKINGLLKTSSGMEVSINGVVSEKFSLNEHFVELQGKIKINNDIGEVLWRLKTSANNEKYLSDAVITHNSVDIFIWNADIHKPIDKVMNAKGIFKLKDIINTSITFKFNPKNGKGESTIVTSLMEVQDEIKIGAKFLSLMPKLEVETIVNIGSEKKYTLKTENILDKSKFSSKNVVLWNSSDKKVQLDIISNFKNEDIHSEIKLTIPEKQLIGKFDRKKTKSGTSIDFAINDDKNIFSAYGKLEKHQRNAKAKIGMASDFIKFDSNLQKLDNVVSFEFISEQWNSIASVGPNEIKFKLNDLQFEGKREKNITSIFVKKNNSFLKSSIILNSGYVKYEHESSLEKLRSVVLVFDHNKNNEYKVSILINKQQFGIDFKHENKYLELTIITPSKQSKVLAKADVEIENKKGNWFIEILNFNEFSGKHTGSFDLQNIQNSKASLNLEFNKKMIYQLDIVSKEEKLLIDIKGEKGNIVRGSLNYAINQEPHKSFIEGQGELLVGEKVTQANFKIMQQIFTTSIDGESGVKFSFTGNFEDRTTINFIKFSDHEVHGKFCLCDDKKECANVELESREGKLLAIIDLKTFGVPYEFDLKSKFKQELLFDARLIDKNNKEVYKVSSTISPLSQKLLFKINSKEFWIQANSKLPENDIYGYYEERLEIGFDKEEKTKLIWTADVTEKQLKLSWECINPQMKTLYLVLDIYSIADRELKANIICDIFDQKDKEIKISLEMKDFTNLKAQLTSKGMNMNKMIQIKNVETPAREVGLLVENGNIEILSLKAEGNIKKFSLKSSIFNNDIISISSEIKADNCKFVANVFGKENLIQFSKSEKHLRANWDLKGILLAEASIAPRHQITLKISEKGGIVFGRSVSLEKGKLLETTKEGDIDQLNKILVIIKDDFHSTLNLAEKNILDAKNKIDQHLDQNMNIINKSLPDFKAVKDFYGKKVSDISIEIEKDIGNIGLYFREYKESFEMIFQSFINFCHEIHKLVTEFNKLLCKVFSEQIIPALKSIIHNITDIFELFVTTIIKKMESSDFSPYINIAAPIIESYIDFIASLVGEFETLYKEYEDIRNLIPTYNEIVSKLNNSIGDFKPSEQFLELLHSVLLQIKSLAPETTEFCDKLYNYFQKKLSGEKVDDFIIIKELLNILKTSLPLEYHLLENISEIDYTSIPKLSLSIFKLIENLPILHNLHLTGHILPSGGFISFDGKFSFYNKNCKLIFAQEYTNNNFTVLGNIKNGQLKSISLVEKASTIEILDNGNVKVNGKNVEWPVVIAGKVIALKEWNKFTIKGLESNVEINCFNSLKYCHVTVSYKYTGKLRGILGNGNGEVFDDFILPNGHIAESEDKFFAAYGIGSCEEWVPKKSQICQNLFTWDSTMSVAFPFINNIGFKSACGIISKCDIAFSYVSAANLRRIPIVLPTECLKCEEKKDFGEEFAINIPTNKADVVFIIDLDVPSQVLQDLVVPTIANTQNDLKDRNFNDINVGIVGYTTKYPEPIILSANIENFSINEPKLNYFEQLFPNLITKSDEKAFELAMRYPFRALATKTIIVIRADGLVLNIGNVGRAILYSAAAEMRGILLQVVQPVSGLSEDVIGFNSKLIVPLKGPKDAKKRANLKYTPNVSIENVLQSGGWVFDFNKFTALSNANDKKSFVHQLTSSIAENLFRTEISGNCKCLTYDGLTGVNSCLVIKNINTSKKIKSGGRR